MTTHTLRCWPESFQLVYEGVKTWEFRRADRDFKVGDTLRLLEYVPEGRMLYPGYTDREVRVRVTLVQHVEQFIEGDRGKDHPGYVVMSVERIMAPHEGG